MNVKAIQHKDVKGNILNYIKITNGEHQVLINVGEKNYNLIKELETVQELNPLDKKHQHDMDNKNK